MALTEEQVINAIRPIEDPELHLGLVDLGLIYGADITAANDGDVVKLTMTFTSPFCPYGPQLKASVERALANLPGVKESKVEIVFSPPWDPHTMASEDCKLALGISWDEEDNLSSSGGDAESQR